MNYKTSLFTSIAVVLLFAVSVIQLSAGEIERPEEIKSKRLVIYDQPTYEKLAAQWKAYYDVYPSEYAYANWMYACRYAQDDNYWELLDKGCEKYKANPTLLYLRALKNQGASNNTETMKLLEQSVALDPSYPDPWFVIAVNQMINRDDASFNKTLKHLLEIGIIHDEVIDFCYNILQSTEKNAIIITNGDNDTYPMWILQNILGIRQDVTVLNRSLLNTEWYPQYMIDHGAPHFITEKDYTKLRKDLNEMFKDGKLTPSRGGTYSDTLIYMIVKAAEKVNRPVYFSCTIYLSQQLRPLQANGKTLGLVTLITKPKESYGDLLRKVYTSWMKDFRTSSLNSWRLKFSPEGDAARQLIYNYATSIPKNMIDIKNHAPGLLEDIFDWYLNYADQYVPDKYRDAIYNQLCEHRDVKRIKEWCRSKGIDR